MVIDNSNNMHEIISNSFYYLLYVLVFMIIFILAFSAPIYFTFKVKNIVSFICLISIIFIAEYFLYVYLGSQKYFFDKEGIYNGIISISFFILFFYKHIRLLGK